MISKKINSCRLCGSTNLDLILDLGDQPPANSLRADLGDKLEAIPLVLCRCSSCTSMQLTENVSPEYLFRDYIWVTGTSQTARDFSFRFHDNIRHLFGDAPPLFVVEIASNDGTFLQPFKKNGSRVLGVDPAQNLACVAEASGIPTLGDFFSLEVAKNIVKECGQADIVFARNVIPHVPDPNDVVAGISFILEEDGVGAIEFHWADKILHELHYDSIYHEHFFYHSLHSIQQLLSRHALTLFDVMESPISGGSLVAYFSKNPRPATVELKNKLLEEVERGLATLSAWQRFASSSKEHGMQLKGMVESEIRAGRRLIGYGASARSSTLLNFCGVDNRHIRCIADQNPLKHDRYTPGTNVLVVSPDRALAERPDTIILLAWNFQDEILSSLADGGFHGHVIVPLPGKPRLLQV